METAQTVEKKRQPLSLNERRVIGTLVEKAKTTPQQYPLSLNSLVTGCNQKSNRSPVLELDEEQVDNALERLRMMGACVEVNADSRTPRYRQTVYEWLGVDKLELAVLAELLLRGDQTVGELRGRATRMDPIEDLAALRPILKSLAEKQLIVYLTPQGRGCTITHNLYEPREMEKLLAKYSAPAGGYRSGSEEEDAPRREPNRIVRVSDEGEVTVEEPEPTNSMPITAERPDEEDLNGDLHAVRNDIRNLKDDLLELRNELQQMMQELKSGIEEVREQIRGL